MRESHGERFCEERRGGESLAVKCSNVVEVDYIAVKFIRIPTRITKKHF